ncbi:1,4-dihydroxy-2-naphthoate octaprenyltransferase [bioreactor metagenome]|uniref:1,4-dihydroxy-2-naphthoate octaprenyltransferase n=1 Tax=bioreactor metagenome TaxID=1076179 RepID=A0A645HT74_9ZZZZ
MIAGGFYAISGVWSWGAVAASIPYSLATVTVIFGKHIDKRIEDKAKHIYTVPVILGETLSRAIILILMALQYILPVVFIFLVPRYFSWIILLVFITPLLIKKQERMMIWNILTHTRPTEPPAEAKDMWPLWNVAAAMMHTRIYGGVFALAMILQTIFWPLIH